MGYDVLHVPDHLGAPAPFPTLMAAAAATETLHVGTFALNAGFYKPALLARDVAAMRDLTGGRLELGLGAGSERSSKPPRFRSRLRDDASSTSATSPSTSASTSPTSRC